MSCWIMPIVTATIPWAATLITSTSTRPRTCWELQPISPTGMPTRIATVRWSMPIPTSVMLTTGTATEQPWAVAWLRRDRRSDDQAPSSDAGDSH